MRIFYIVNVHILHIVNVQVYDQWYEARNPKFFLKLRRKSALYWNRSFSETAIMKCAVLHWFSSFSETMEKKRAALIP